MIEQVHEFADHHLAGKSAGQGKTLFNLQHGYVQVKDAKGDQDQYNCEVLSQAGKFVTIPKE